MHELGIVTYVARTVTKIADENGVKRVGAVILEIGEVSGIVGDYLADCWNYFRNRYPVLAEAELEYEILPAVTYCEECEREYATVQYGRICPYCGSEKTYLFTGNECNIKELKVYERSTNVRFKNN